MINTHTMKNLILLFSFLAIVSCNGQTDLETLKFDEKVPGNIVKGEKETEANYGLLAYKQADVQNYKLGTVSFRPIQFQKDTSIQTTIFPYSSTLIRIIIT
jgi:hypothetical protein